MLIVFPLTFVADTQIIYGFNFTAPLKAPILKNISERLFLEFRGCCFACSILEKLSKCLQSNHLFSQVVYFLLSHRHLDKKC